MTLNVDLQVVIKAHFPWWSWLRGEPVCLPVCLSLSVARQSDLRPSRGKHQYHPLKQTDRQGALPPSISLIRRHTHLSIHITRAANSMPDSHVTHRHTHPTVIYLHIVQWHTHTEYTVTHSPTHVTHQNTHQPHTNFYVLKAHQIQLTTFYNALSNITEPQSPQ